jgi:hypothetical protein
VVYVQPSSRPRITSSNPQQDFGLGYSIPAINSTQPCRRHHKPILPVSDCPSYHLCSYSIHQAYLLHYSRAHPSAIMRPTHLAILAILLSTAYCFVRWIALPFVFRQLTRIRVHSLGFTEAAGLEWRTLEQADAVIPTLRIEKVELRWGTSWSNRETGLVVLCLDGISLRIKEREKAETSTKPVSAYSC